MFLIFTRLLSPPLFSGGITCDLVWAQTHYGVYRTSQSSLVCLHMQDVLALLGLKDDLVCMCMRKILEQNGGKEAQ